MFRARYHGAPSSRASSVASLAAPTPARMSSSRRRVERSVAVGQRIEQWIGRHYSGVAGDAFDQAKIELGTRQQLLQRSPDRAPRRR